MMEVPPDVSLIELHDSVLEVVELRGSGVHLGIERLYVFRQVRPELYDVWCYRAVVVVDDVSEVSVVGSLSDAWISDTIVERLHKRVDLTDLLHGCEIDSIALILRSGSDIRIKGKRARMEFRAALEVVEQWEGPLVTKVPAES